MLNRIDWDVEKGQVMVAHSGRSESRAEKAERLDLVSMLLEGQARQWPWWCSAMLAAGLLILALYVRHERRSQHDAPLMVLSLFRCRTLSGGLVAQPTFGLLSRIFFITWTL